MSRIKDYKVEILILKPVPIHKTCPYTVLYGSVNLSSNTVLLEFLAVSFMTFVAGLHHGCNLHLPHHKHFNKHVEHVIKKNICQHNYATVGSNQTI